MEVDDERIGWKTVTNTVASRMIGLSLIHKLIPSRKLRKRTKALNMGVKGFPTLKSYSQYIKMKTAILRNILEDSDTDDSASFTEEDYGILYKSDVSLRNYVSEMATKSVSFSCEEDSEADGDNAMFNSTEKENDSDEQVNRMKSKKSRVVNLGWQRVIKKKRRKHSLVDPEDNDTMDPLHYSHDEMDTSTTTEPTDENVHLTVPQEENQTLVPTGSTGVQTMDAVETDIGGTERNRITNKKLDMEVPLNKESFNGISINKRPHLAGTFKRNLTALLDGIDTAKNTKDVLQMDSDTHRNGSLDQQSLNINVGKTKPSYSKGNVKTFQELGAVYATNQLKDSGIDEDSEEEFLKNGKHIVKLSKNANTNESADSNVNKELSAASEIDLGHENCNISDKSEARDATPCKMNGSPSKLDKQDEKQKQKLQPKVTCTEIVSKRYKIISSDARANDSEEQSGSKDSEHFCSQRMSENSDEDVAEEDAMSPSTTKRLQQLKRLNLTVDSEGSDDESEPYAIENEENNLFQSPRTSIDALGNDAEEINNSTETDWPCLEDLSGKPAKRNKSRSTRLATGTANCNHQDMKEASSDREILSMNSGIFKRPHNLQELMEQRDLVEEVIQPSFRFKDICDDDIFIVDLPNTMLQSQLLGKKIVLTQKKLKVGKQKFNVLYKDLDVVTCIFGTGKSRRPYKAVNVKPVARILTSQRVRKDS